MVAHVLLPLLGRHISLSLNQTRKEKQMKNLLMRLWKEEEGQDLVEYALLVALVALAVTAGMKTLANSINNEFSNIGASLTT
jgi:pilus assembly protein Flp/PilA